MIANPFARNSPRPPLTATARNAYSWSDNVASSCKLPAATSASSHARNRVSATASRIWASRAPWISTAFYVLMGWLALIYIVPIVRALPPGGLALIIAGGICYSGGVVFFAWRTLRYSHAIWHLFVIAGAACHVLAVTLFILR